MQAKSAFLFLFFTIIHFGVYAQKDTIYLNARGMKTEPILAAFYKVRTVAQTTKSETIEEFDALLGYKTRFYSLKKLPELTMPEVVVTGYGMANGQQVPTYKRPEIVAPTDSFMVKHGLFMEWYPSGDIKTKGIYFGGKLNGLFETYYPNGKPKQVETYRLDTLKTGRAFDSLGTEIAHTPYLELPKFPNGQGAFFRFLGQTIKYPRNARESGVQETILVRFTIDTSGKLTNIKVAQGKTADLKTESIRTVSELPKWIPAKQDGENIAMTFVLPIKFRLE